VISTNRIPVPAIDARRVKAAATEKVHKGKHGSATALSGVAISTAKPKGEKLKHTGKEHCEHYAVCNATLAASNSTNAASNSTNTALNSTITALNCTLTASNSTLAASNITEAAGTGSNANATATTKTSTAEKKTGARDLSTRKISGEGQYSLE
jgi:hypothetical protein